MCVCMYVGTYVRTYARTHAWMHVCRVHLHADKLYVQAASFTVGYYGIFLVILH